MFTQLVPMSEGSVGGIGVVLPPLYEIFWSALVLLVILLVVGLYALPRIYSMIDQRRDAIQEGLDNAEKAREDLSLASRKKDELLRDAQAEATRSVKMHVLRPSRSSHRHVLMRR